MGKDFFNPFKVSSLFLITFNLNMRVIVNVKASKADIALFKHSGNVCFGYMVVTAGLWTTWYGITGMIWYRYV